jgi:hypothetical protein
MTTCAQPTYRSSGNVLPEGLFKRLPRSQVSFRITVDRHDREYNTLDRVWGQLAIVCMTDTPFRDLTVELVGETRTNVDRVSTPTGVPSFAAGFHRFLVLEQPACLRDWEGERVFKAGRPYFFPFTFTIPDKLPPNVCQHPVADEKDRSSHLTLPPSLGYGTRGLLGSGDTLAKMVTIRYMIHTSLYHLEADHRTGAENLIIHVVPTIQDQSIGALLPSANTSPVPTSVNVLRSLLFFKSPQTISLRSLRPYETCYLDRNRSQYYGGGTLSLLLQIELRFESVGRCAEPPGIRSFDVELQARTAMACIPFEENTADNELRSCDVSKLLHCRTVHLTTTPVGTLDWTKIPGYGDHNARSSFTANVSLPVTLPQHVAHVPTFHSCLVSRDYAIQVRARSHQFIVGTRATTMVPLLVCLGGSSRLNSSQLSDIIPEFAPGLSSGLQTVTNPQRDSQESSPWQEDDVACLPSYREDDTINAGDVREARHIWRGV